MLSCLNQVGPNTLPYFYIQHSRSGDLLAADLQHKFYKRVLVSDWNPRQNLFIFPNSHTFTSFHSSDWCGNWRKNYICQCPISQMDQNSVFIILTIYRRTPAARIVVENAKKRISETQFHLAHQDSLRGRAATSPRALNRPPAAHVFPSAPVYLRNFALSHRHHGTLRPHHPRFSAGIAADPESIPLMKGWIPDWRLSLRRNARWTIRVFMMRSCWRRVSEMRTEWRNASLRSRLLWIRSGFRGQAMCFRPETRMARESPWRNRRCPCTWTKWRIMGFSFKCF